MSSSTAAIHSPAARQRGGWPGLVFSSLADGLLDALFPPRCPLCSSLLGVSEAGFCHLCRAAFLAVPATLCRRCQAVEGQSDGLCCTCRTDPPPTRRAIAFGIYGGTLEEAIHRFKLQGERRLAAPLALLLLEEGAPGLAPGEHDLLIPVPLHPRRLRARGFNQAVLLGRELGRAWSLPLALDALRRVVDTPAQRNLGAEERRQNLQGAFSARRERVAGQRVLLVDDVITTGSTISECARALLQAGASAVTALALARALPERLVP